MNSITMPVETAQRVLELLAEWEVTSDTHDYSELEESVLAEFPRMTPVDLEEVRLLVKTKLEFDAHRAKRIAELIKEARRLSGNPDMVTYKALAYLAERGHEEASGYLDMMVQSVGMKRRQDILM